MAQLTSDTSNGLYIAPFVSAMDASSSDDLIAGIATAQQQVSIAGIHKDFTAFPHVLNTADAVKFLNLFTVTGNNNDESNLSVTFADDAAGFAAGVLKDMIDGCIDSAPGGDGVNLADWLMGEIGAYATAWILDNIGVSITDPYDPTVSVDSTGGAAAAVSNLDVPSATTMYLQLPQDQLENATYMDADKKATTDALPLVPGDRLVFVFDVAVQNGVITLEWGTLDSTNALADGTHKGASVADTDAVPSYTMSTDAAANQTIAEQKHGKYSYHLSAKSTDIGTQRVAFALQFGTSGAAAFTVGEGGLRAVPA